MRNLSCIIILALMSCGHQVIGDANGKSIIPAVQNKQKGWMERLMIEMGMVDIQSQVPEIYVDLMYSDTANFLHEDVYGRIERCYLNKETTIKLVRADSILRSEYPQYRFKVYDGARPHRIQVKMYELYREMPVMQGLYLSHPDKHSVHNYGAAVDLTICDTLGNPIDMGTPVDYFGIEAHIVDEWYLVNSGRISQQAYENRLLLRRVMRKAGFTPILYEWWHFNTCSRYYAQKYYTFIP